MSKKFYQVFSREVVMKTARYFIFLVLMLFFPINTQAKINSEVMHGESGQHMMGPNYQANKNTMNKMMGDMNQLRDHGSLTPEHQEEMQRMMDQLGEMRQQMGTPHGAYMQDYHQRRLLDMQQRLDVIKRQTQR
jgi:hypothetical protein